MSRGEKQFKLSCEGKVRFSSMDAASQVASARSRRTRRNRKPYHCEHCNAYHIGQLFGRGKFGRRPRETVAEDESMP